MHRPQERPPGGSGFRRGKYKFKRGAVFGIYTHVKRMSVWLVILGALVLPARALAIATEASLQLSARVAKPGTTITAAVRLVMAPDWHT